MWDRASVKNRREMSVKTYSVWPGGSTGNTAEVAPSGPRPDLQYPQGSRTRPLIHDSFHSLPQ